jgi:hypothetical protein
MSISVYYQDRVYCPRVIFFTANPLKIGKTGSLSIPPLLVFYGDLVYCPRVIYFLGDKLTAGMTAGPQIDV